MNNTKKRKQVLPGFGLTMGFTIFYLSIIVLLPFDGLIAKTALLPLDQLWRIITDPRAIASYKLSFGASAISAVLNGIFGLLTAWVLARYKFPGRRIMDALVDLPFALPTAVAGIALTTLYAPNGWIGSILKDFGIKAAFAPLGVTIALTFVGLPFVVRTVQPVIQNLALDVEEAAACLGADRWQTFWRVILPALGPSWLTGMAMAFGRAVGEYGSIVFISGNLPYKTEITPLLIVTKLEQYDYRGAAALGVVMLVSSFIILMFINLLQWWSYSKYGKH
jgi:sulfate transport system permease protein